MTLLAACGGNDQKLPMQTATATVPDLPLPTVSLPATNTPPSNVTEVDEFIDIDAVLEEIDRDVCQKAHEMQEEIEALLAQGVELEELATAIDELREEMANCPPSLTPTP